MSVRGYSLNFAPRPTPRGRDGKELIQCPTSSCDGMGHVSGNYATHRRQGNIDVYTKSLTLDYVYIDMAMQHARTHVTYTYVLTLSRKLITCWFVLIWFLNETPSNSFHSRTVDYDMSCARNTHTHIHTDTRTHATWNKFARIITFTWMVLASMHIGGPWRSCFLNVLRYETYV